MAPMIPRNSPKSPFSGIADSPKFPEPPYRGAGVFGGNFRGRQFDPASPWNARVGQARDFLGSPGGSSNTGNSRRAFALVSVFPGR